MRYFLKLAYNGADFHGWQSQPNAVGVQQRVEESLSTVLRVQTPIVGAGRTDAGVHARCMYAHFDTSEPIADKGRFLQSINRLAGKEIAFSDLIEVADDAHARFDATERTYKYFVTFSKSPFLHPFAWNCPSRLDVSAMNEAARILLSTSDFTSFAKLHSDVKTNICDVRHAEWRTLNDDPAFNDGICLPAEGLVFTITADRFLRNMVRAVVGTLVEVGRGKMTVDGFREVVAKKDRCAAGTSMPACALFLWDVKYPYIESSDL